MTIGEKIKELRIQNGMTLEEVGEIVGVNKSTVRKWETGFIANMRRDKIALLAKALHVSPEYLMGWTDESAPKTDPPRSDMGFILQKSTKEVDELTRIFESLDAKRRYKLLAYAWQLEDESNADR